MNRQIATTFELAERYRVGVETIRSWARQGRIPCLRAGRHPLLFDLAEVELALRERGNNRAHHHEGVVSSGSPGEG